MAELASKNAPEKDDEQGKKQGNSPTETNPSNPSEEENNEGNTNEEPGEKQEGGNEAPVNILDPDFLCFALPFALIVDVLDIVLDLLTVIVIPKVIGIIIDCVVFAILGGWMYWRTGQAAKRKKEQKAQMEKQLAEKSAKMEKQLAKGATKGPLRKVFMRMGVVLIGEIIPFLGLIPFWTISIMSTLKAEKEE